MVRVTPLADRFWQKVDKTPDCWIWTGAKNGPYGSIYVHEFKRGQFAHRVAWFLEHDKWPHLIDHLCRNQLCVRIDHLEDTTYRENMMRGNHPSAIVARTGICKQGHSGWGTAKDGKRFCRICRAAAQHRKYLKMRANGTWKSHRKASSDDNSNNLS